MLFKDILIDKSNKVSAEFKRLEQHAFSVQSHAGDLLLLYVNGFHSEEIERQNSLKFNPYVIGPDIEGHSEALHGKFISNYINNSLSDITRENYLKELVWSNERKDIIAQLLEFESITIQFEMLIYIKLWEADMIIRKFYQFVRILHGESYDWYFRLPKSRKDTTAPGKRVITMLTDVRDKIKDVSPLIYDLMKETYIPQIRNSIAHSNYSFLGRQISLNNFFKADPNAQLRQISFDEWIEIIHNSLVLNSEFVRLQISINEHYGINAANYDNTFPIQITDRSGKKYEKLLSYRPEFKDWGL